ncbi:hypothetical protein AZE42_00999 [Rhizopogon vesiculosus]|uniref:Rhodopsin domain-containing protein n=1 Tax=Rhizopogon vesiculosus TaxID=180088 RepID=A0A1J8PKT0_9AGAM|nr:hypothetical protein AZE42_00999 [Rhizopogon vesiculosus]
MSTLLIPSGNHWETIQAVACVFHGCAIAATIFRLAYRWYTSRFWWEDTWAAIALVFDIICLIGISWGNFDDPHVLTFLLWVLPIAFACVLWAARISIIYSILRVGNPQNARRWIVYGIIAGFVIMWIVLIVQRVMRCKYSECNMGIQVSIALVITDTISDLTLVIVPTYFLRDVRLTSHQRILVISAFYASLLITAIAIPLSVLLSVEPFSDATLIFGHVKSATSLMVANLLVIVSFVYRFWRSGADLDQPGAEFTSVLDLSQLTDRSQSMANTATTATGATASTQTGSVFGMNGKSTQLSSDISPLH